MCRESMWKLFEPRMMGTKRTAKSAGASGGAMSSAEAKAKPAFHQIWRREFTSWKALRVMVAEHVFHQVRHSECSVILITYIGS